MAIKNVPNPCPDSIKVNLALATGMQSLQGDATSYGAFQAVVADTQDRVVQALDPRDCTSKIWENEVGGFGVNIEITEPDCTTTELDDEFDFSCTTGETATPTSRTIPFNIDQTLGTKVTLSYKQWTDSCCDIVQYQNDVLDARREGKALAPVMQRAIDQLTRGGGFDRMYNAKLISELLYTKFNAPQVGLMHKLNDHALTQLKAGVGYNWYVDPFTGDPVGEGDWELPVLTSSVTASDPTLIPYGLKRIDPNLFRLFMEDFIRRHPRCGSGMTLIGGSIFAKLRAEVGIQAGLDSNGTNQAAVLQRALGFMGNIYEDNMIDAKFGDGSFFIMENNVASLFWLSLYGDSRYNTPNAYRWTDGSMVEKLPNFRDVGVLPVTVGNCRNGNITLPFDMFVHTPHFANLGCAENPSFNIQMRAKYKVFTRPAFGCDAFNPTTGIYYGKMTDVVTEITA